MHTLHAHLREQHCLVHAICNLLCELVELVFLLAAGELAIELDEHMPQPAAHHLVERVLVQVHHSRGVPNAVHGYVHAAEEEQEQGAMAQHAEEERVRGGEVLEAPLTVRLR
jgi:hypothetical protein